MNKIKKNKAKELTFFTAAHGLYHFDISQETFDNSLYMNLLFFSTGLAWSDHFFIQGNYVSRHLQNHRKSLGDSWIEAGLKEKRIIPFFRREPNFVALDSSMKEQKLKGLHPDSKYLAKLFDAAVSEYGVWPSFMIAERYYERLTDYFQTENPYWFGENDEQDFSEVGKIWGEIKDWGIADIENGLNRTKNKGGKGVQVSEIINATAFRFLKKEIDGINSVDDLLLLLRKTKVDQETLNNLRVFYSLIMEIYNRNLALSLNTKPNSPITDAHILASQTYKKNYTIARTSPIGIELHVPDLDITRVSISLPSLQVLRNTPGRTLRKIWDSNDAIDYFDALRKWRSSPLADKRKGTLYDAAVKYSETINRLIGNDVKHEDYEIETINTTLDLLGVLASTASVAFVQVTDLPAEIKLGVSLSSASAAYSLKRIAKHLLTKRPLPNKEVELNFVPFIDTEGRKNFRDLTDISPY